MEADSAVVDRYKPRGLAGCCAPGREPARTGRRAFERRRRFRQELAFRGRSSYPLGCGSTQRDRAALLVGPVLLVLIWSSSTARSRRRWTASGLNGTPLADSPRTVGSAAVLMSFVRLTAVWLLVLLGR